MNIRTRYSSIAFWTSALLILFCIAWEWFLAPLRPGGSWMILKIIPLALTMKGLYRADNYTMQACSMVILLYVTEALVRFSDPGINPSLAGIELALSLIIFTTLLKHLRPLKKAAKAKKLAEHENDKRDDS